MCVSLTEREIIADHIGDDVTMTAATRLNQFNPFNADGCVTTFRQRPTTVAASKCVDHQRFGAQVEVGPTQKS